MFDEFNKTMAPISEVAYTEDIVTKFVSVTEMQDKLEEGGIQVLDVRCGRGMRIAELGSFLVCTDVADISIVMIDHIFNPYCW